MLILTHHSQDLVNVFERSVDKTLALIEGQIRMVEAKNKEVKVRTPWLGGIRYH